MFSERVFRHLRWQEHFGINTALSKTSKQTKKIYAARSSIMRTLISVITVAALLVVACNGVSAQLIPPWMLGDESTIACYFNNQTEINPAPKGISMAFDQSIPTNLDSATSVKVSYSLAIDSAVFFAERTIQLLFGANLEKFRAIVALTSSSAACTTAAAKAECLVWHSNLHSCKAETGTCLPFIVPQNDTSTGAVLVTHTGAQIGHKGPFESNLRLPVGNWIIIAHVRIGDLQCAVGARRSVAAPEPTGLGVGAIIGIAMGFAGVLVVAVILLMCMRKKHMEAVRDNSKAPKAPPLCILFTDVQSSTSLWCCATRSMARSIDLHFDCIRKCLQKHSLYEIKSVGDSVMAMVASPEAAVACALDIQRELQKCTEWPACINDAYTIIEQHGTDSALLHELHDDPDDTVGKNVPEKFAFNGIRVRIGIALGSDITIYEDSVTKGFDVAGPLANLASRVEGIGKKGGIICCNETLRNAVSDALVAKMGGKFRALGQAALKGISEPQSIIELQCTDLPVPRVFPLLDDSALKVVEGEDEMEEQQEVRLRRASNAAPSVRTGRSAAVGSTQALCEDDFPGAIRAAFTRRHGLVSNSTFSYDELLYLAHERMQHHLALIKPLKRADQEKFVTQMAEAWRTPVVKNAIATTLAHTLSRVIMAEYARGRPASLAALGRRKNSFSTSNVSINNISGTNVLCPNFNSSGSLSPHLGSLAPLGASGGGVPASAAAPASSSNNDNNMHRPQIVPPTTKGGPKPASDELYRVDMVE